MVCKTMYSSSILLGTSSFLTPLVLEMLQVRAGAEMPDVQSFDSSELS